MKRYSRRRETASVLVIVLWVSFGLVSLTLYFAQSMSYELRAADNRVAAIQAEQAIAGAVRYCSNVLGNVQLRGSVPDILNYSHEAVPVGEAYFWFIGRSDQSTRAADIPFFALTDEAARLNINVATRAMLEALPGMPVGLAAAIVDWRDADEEVTDGGAEAQTYLRLNPPYRCKNAAFESLDELRLVAGAYLDILYGEDANQNGALDPNENDGELLPPNDNRDGGLDRGLMEYFTVYSQQPASGTNVNDSQGITALLQLKLSADRANEIVAAAGTTSGNIVQFYVNSQMTAQEFAQIEGDLVGTNRVGLININTASEAVLACIPGIGVEKAATVAAYRRSNPAQLNSVAWIKDVLDTESVAQAGPWITGRTHQLCADVAAVGRHGRGYTRSRFIVDTTDEAPKILYRQELTHLGWALGAGARNTLAALTELR